MDFSPVTEAAVALWISQGVTSLTHPLLELASRTCFAPLGIVADWFEAEPFSSLESGLADGWLRRPRWNPATLDPNHPAAADLQAWALQPQSVRVQTDAVFVLPAGTDERAAWAVVRHSIAARERARAFLAAAAASLLFDPESAAIYLAGDAAAFAQGIWAQIEEPMARTEDGTAAAKLPVPDRTAAPARPTEPTPAPAA